MNSLLHNRFLSDLIRIGLGCIFLYSSWPKIADPPAFAHVLYNYKILPGSLINAFALLLPWIEAIAGCALVLGRMRRGAAILVGVLLIAFSMALAADLMRGIAVDCGCFSVSASSKTQAELFRDMKMDLLRDFGMLLMALQVFWSRANRYSPPAPSTLPAAEASGIP